MRKKLLVSLLVLSMVLAFLPLGAAAEGAVGKQQQTISAGFNHAGAIDGSGSLWTWGNNFCGQLGNGYKGDKLGEYETSFSQSIPVKVLDDVISVSASSRMGGNFSFYNGVTAAIKSDNSLWAWGSAGSIANGIEGNKKVDIPGFGDIGKIQDIPVKVMDEVESVVMGSALSYVVKTDKSLWAISDQYWWDEEKQEDVLIFKAPEKVMDNVISADAGEYSFAAVKSDHTLWMWGTDYGYYEYNEETETYGLQLSPTPKKVLDDVAAVSVGAGGDSASSATIAAIKTDGSLWMWGDALKTATPTKIMDDVVAVSNECGTTVAIKKDASLWSWEPVWGEHNWEGPGKPEKIMDNVAEVSVGCGFVMAKKTDGSVWTWGNNDSYQLGNGGVFDKKDEYGNISQTVPLQIAIPTSQQPPTPPTPSTPSFTDVKPGDWYADAVAFGVERGLLKGVTEDSFAPNAQMNRAMFCIVLARNDKVDTEGGANWYEKAVNWAKEKGYFDGKDPENDISRQEMAVMLYKHAGSPKVSGNLDKFADASKVPASAKDAMLWATQNEYINGKDGNLLDPLGTATRAEVVMIFMRVFK